MEGSTVKVDILSDSVECVDYHGIYEVANTCLGRSTDFKSIYRLWVNDSWWCCTLAEFYRLGEKVIATFKKICNRRPLVGAGGLTSGGMPEEVSASRFNNSSSLCSEVST